MVLNALLLALREIRNNLLRAGLTTLGIVIGVAAVILMVTLGAGATKRVTGDLGSLGNNMLLLVPGQQRGPPTAVVPFDVATVEAIQREIPGLADVVPELAVQAVAVNGNRNHSTQVNGTTNAYLRTRSWDLSQGREFSPAEILGGKSVCLVGQTVRRELYGDQVPLGARMRINKASCEIIGFLSSKGESIFGQDMDDIVLMPLKAVQRRLAGNTEVNVIRISVANESDIPGAKDQIQRLMRVRRHILPGQVDDFDVEDLKEITQLITGVTVVLTAFLSAVAAVSLLVGGIGIMNIMLVSVTERTREIGIRLAIGARERDVLLQFLIEAMVMSALGGVLGVMIGLGGSAAAAGALKLPFVFQPGVVIVAVGFAAIVGVAFGFFPARRAARLDPIEALRHE
ncbi:MAG TPA: ABC transporter permease [Rhizomicrobium sp.]|jgi:putative ABC transport system permease protein|nr:ABC transporter permease [Rhizomicrobium sp.]